MITDYTNADKKLQLYFGNNIVIPSNLIITKDTPLGFFDGLSIKIIIKSVLK